MSVSTRRATPDATSYACDYDDVCTDEEIASKCGMAIALSLQNVPGPSIQLGTGHHQPVRARFLMTRLAIVLPEESGTGKYSYVEADLSVQTSWQDERLFNPLDNPCVKTSVMEHMLSWPLGGQVT